MDVKLIEPIVDKNWSLNFSNVPYNEEYDSHDLIHNIEKSNIWYWCQHFGKIFNTHPFLQGNCNDWMMIEFWCKSETLILETCISICNELKIELKI